MKVFLDTNVIIDFYDERPQFFDAAAQIITKAYSKDPPTSLRNKHKRIDKIKPHKKCITA